MPASLGPPDALFQSCNELSNRHPIPYSSSEDLTGKIAKDVWTAKLHVQPELASGIRSKPPAGIMLIQHPGRVIVVTFEDWLVSKSNIVGFA